MGCVFCLPSLNLVKQPPRPSKWVTVPALYPAAALPQTPQSGPNAGPGLCYQPAWRGSLILRRVSEKDGNNLEHRSRGNPGPVSGAGGRGHFINTAIKAGCHGNASHQFLEARETKPKRETFMSINTDAALLKQTAPWQGGPKCIA